MTGELLRFTVRKKKMRKEYYTNSKDYINRWVISYADFVTMLLALFVVMYAVSQLDNGKLQQFQTHLTNTFVENTQSKNVTKYQTQVRDNLINCDDKLSRNDAKEDNETSQNSQAKQMAEHSSANYSPKASDTKEQGKKR